MILHTINKSPFTHNTLDECLSLCSENTSVLFIEDGVYAATNNIIIVDKLKRHENIHFYALKADIVARGLSSKLNPSIKLVDDVEFVNLCTTHDTVQSWY